MHTGFAISGGKKYLSLPLTPLFTLYHQQIELNRSALSKCWHQQLRRSITTPAKAIVEALRIPKGTHWARYTELHLAFFFSTLYHIAASYLIGRTEGGMFRLWMSQATCIMIEDYVVHLGKQWGFKENGMRAHSPCPNPRNTITSDEPVLI
jgi:hypothetical protein